MEGGGVWTSPKLEQAEREREGEYCLPPQDIQQRSDSLAMMRRTCQNKHSSDGPRCPVKWLKRPRRVPPLSLQSLTELEKIKGGGGRRDSGIKGFKHPDLPRPSPPVLTIPPGWWGSEQRDESGARSEKQLCVLGCGGGV